MSHRAYQQTTQSLQRAKTKGQELASWIPILVSARTHLLGSCSLTSSLELVLLSDETFQAPWSKSEQGTFPLLSRTSWSWWFLRDVHT